MAKQKVLIIMPSMFIGGAERSLLGLLDSLNYDKYEVNFFLYRHEGEFLQYINKNVHILSPIPEYATFDVPIKSLILSKNIKFGLLRLKAKLDQRVRTRRTGKKGMWMCMQMISKNLLPSLPDIPGEYDLGIMFLGVPDVLVKKVKAKKKVAWNHTDYTRLRPDVEYDIKTINSLDYIVNVSEECRKQFLKVYPQFQDKAIVIENILSKELIQKLSEEQIDDELYQKRTGIRVLSIGRYTHAKNFDNIPPICKRIIEKGVDITWYIIGYGGDEEKIRTAIQENGMTDSVILLGKKENPYPYIKACDVYIQPSRYEGKSVTVREAQILGKPIIISRYATAASQVADGIDGLIVPQPNEECADEIARILKDEDLLQKIANQCQKGDYTNSSEVEKLTALL